MDLDELKKERAKLVEQLENIQKDVEAFDRIIMRLTRPGSVNGKRAVLKFDSRGSAPVTIPLTRPEMIRRAIDALDGQFTKDVVVEKVAELFPGEDMDEQAVSSFIWKLSKKGRELKQSRKGYGGQPNVYEKVRPTEIAATA